MPIDAARARTAIEKIAETLGRDAIETAYGIHILANANMLRAIKAVTTYRGRDPRDFALMAFGLDDRHSRPLSSLLTFNALS